MYRYVCASSSIHMDRYRKREGENESEREREKYKQMCSFAKI